MEICGEYFTQQTDKDLSGSVVQHYRHVFPALSERRVLVRQAANLWQFKAALQRRLTFVSGQAHTPVQPIDTLPLPVCTYTRARRDRCFAGIAAYSYCDAKDLSYYGFKLDLRISRCGMIMQRSVTNYCAHTSPSRQWGTKLVEGRHAGWSALLHTLLQSNLVHSHVHFVAYDFCRNSQILGLFWLSMGTEEIILTKH